MDIQALGFAAIGFGAIVGGGVVVGVFDELPVEFVSLTFDGAGLEYNRVVNTADTQRAVYTRQFIDLVTETAVPECTATGSADYSPSEPEVQYFPIPEACLSALVEGREYQAWANVAPYNGEPDSIRTDPFVWAD